MPQSPDGTAAHRIWQIPELLLSVMEACHIAKNRLAGVASVSRSFWAIAVPLLWETIPGRHDITEVLDFFSVTAAENDEKNAQEIRRSLYATYAKSLVLTTNVLGEDELAQLLRFKPLSTVFPNLQRLKISLPFCPDGLLDNIVDNLKLSELEFIFKKGLSGLDSLVAAVSQKIRQDLRGLEALELQIDAGGGSAPVQRQSELALVIESLPRLRRLSFHGFGDAFQQHWIAASQLALLEEVHFVGNIHLHADTSPGPKFKGPVKKVKLLWVETDAIPALLAVLNADRLVELNLSADPLLNPDGGMMNGRLSMLQTFTNLKGLELEFDGETMEWEDFVPILSCQKLTDLWFSAKLLAAELTDDSLSAMALAWPRMQRLNLVDSSLGQEDPGHPIPAATLRGLCNFAKHCRSMECITIAVDARAVRQDAPISTFASNEFTYLNLDGPVADEMVEDIGSFIARIAPRIDTRYSWGMWRPVEGVQGELWQRVRFHVDSLLN